MTLRYSYVVSRATDSLDAGASSNWSQCAALFTQRLAKDVVLKSALTISTFLLPEVNYGGANTATL